MVELGIFLAGLVIGVIGGYWLGRHDAEADKLSSADGKGSTLRNGGPDPEK